MHPRKPTSGSGSPSISLEYFLLDIDRAPLSPTVASPKTTRNTPSKKAGGFFSVGFISVSALLINNLRPAFLEIALPCFSCKKKQQPKPWDLKEQ